MSGFAPVRPPRPPSVRGAARPPSGAPRPPRRARTAEVTAGALQPFPEPVGEWAGRPRTEYVVWYFLTKRLGFKEGVDFLYQAAIPAPGLNQVKGFFRGDFGSCLVAVGAVLDHHTIAAMSGIRFPVSLIGTQARIDYAVASWHKAASGLSGSTTKTSMSNRCA